MSYSLTFSAFYYFPSPFNFCCCRFFHELCSVGCVLVLEAFSAVEHKSAFYVFRLLFGYFPTKCLAAMVPCCCHNTRPPANAIHPQKLITAVTGKLTGWQAAAAPAAVALFKVTFFSVFVPAWLPMPVCSPLSCGSSSVRAHQIQ